MTNPYYYKGPNPTVDLVLLDPEEKILLVLRSNTASACAGMWAIPGGFVDTTAKKNELWLPGFETTEQAAFRELVEETGIHAHLLEHNRLQFNGVYEGNQRDPRDNPESWSKSTAFFYSMNLKEKNIINSVKGINDDLDFSEVADTKWFTIKEISEMTLAFDHNKIISDTVLKLNLNSKSEIKKIKP